LRQGGERQKDEGESEKGERAAHFGLQR
jgi:hypothetical protein